MDSFKIIFYFQGGLRASFHQSFVSLDQANISMHKLFSNKEYIRLIGGVLDTSKANGFSIVPAGVINTDNRLVWEFMKQTAEN